MIVHPQGLGSAGSNAGTAVGGAVAAAGGLVSGTIIGLPAGAVMAAVGGLIALGSTIAGALHIGEGCGPTCIQATQIVNQAEPTFKVNLDAYENGVIDRATAVSNFNQMWVAIQQSCGAIPGTAGADCVGDRKEGACKWKDNGECWNWFVGYRDPLLKDPTNAPVVSTSSSTVGEIDSSLIIGGALLLVAMMTGKD